MKSFTFSIPQNIVMGEGALKQLPQIASKIGGKKAYIVSDPILKQMGTVDACAGYLKEAGLESDEFTETEGNPSVETVEKATEGFKASGADFLVALGGGSAMDVAKAVGVVATYGGSITEYEGAQKVPGDIVPQIAIPTTAGTGSEVTAFSVITDHSRNYKLTVFSYKLLPAYVILDSELLATVPASVAAACGMDAFIHAMESYISVDASPFTEAMSEKAMELIGANIRRFVANRKDTEAASAMITGSMLAGIAFSWARLGDVHAMSHPVSAYYNVPHGVANSILLPVVTEFNKLTDTGKYLKIYNYIAPVKAHAHTFDPEMLVEAIRKLNAELGIPATLSAFNPAITDEHFEAMAEDAMKSGNIAANPRTTTIKDVIALYKKAL